MTVTAPTLADVRSAARRRLPRFAFDFIDGGADGEVTLAENVAAFDRLTLRPRHLVDVSHRSQAVDVFGRELSLPVLIAPTGLARIAGRGGDVAGVRAAGRAGTVFTLSTMSNDSIEDAAAHASGPLWFQLYLWPQPEVVKALVARARHAEVHALVVTVDVPVIGKRVRDLRNGFTVPPRPGVRIAFDLMRHPRWLRSLRPQMAFGNLAAEGVRTPARALAHADLARWLANPAASWEDLRRLREAWNGPLLLKGILTAEAAAAAVACGVDGIIVSNHGGRQLDGGPAAIDALPEVVAAAGGQVDVFLDGGIRRGTDVVKALALGAKACLIGRPWLYGLAVDGEQGVLHVLELLRDEIDRTLALVGRPSLRDLDPSLIGTGSNDAARRYIVAGA